jgi:hypothetical protein
MPLPFWTIGCIYGASAVTLGAFGAHGLKKKIADPARIANWNTAAHYQVRLRSSSHPHMLILFSTVGALRRPSPFQRRCSEEYTRVRIVCSRHDDVQRQHIPSCPRPAAIQGIGSYYTVGGIVFDRWLGCTGIWKEDTVSEVIDWTR